MHVAYRAFSGRSCALLTASSSSEKPGSSVPSRSNSQKFRHIERFPVCEHKTYCSAGLLGQDGQGFALAVLAGQFNVQLPARFVAFEEELGCQGEGPAQMSVADLFAGGAEFLAMRFLDAGDQAATGGNTLNLGERVNALDLVKHVVGIDPAQRIMETD